MDFKLLWLYSPWFNIAVVTIFVLFLVLVEGFLLRCRSLHDIARFLAIVLVSLSFGSAKTSQLFLGYVKSILNECARFVSVALILVAYFRECLKRIRTASSISET